MEETVNEHYRRLLQLHEPREVTAEEEDIIGQRVAVRLPLPAGRPANSPVCGRIAGNYDRLKEPSWRHLNVMQYLLGLRCAVPRRQYPEHSVNK